MTELMRSSEARKRPLRGPRIWHRAERVRTECARLGIEIMTLPSGAFRLIGPGVDLMTTELRYVHVGDLQPGRTDRSGARTWGAEAT